MVKYEESLNAVFRALSDPARRAMLTRLSLGEATLGQLAELLAMSLPAVHRHLSVLEIAGLVNCEKRGRERWCRLESTSLNDAQAWISERCSLWEGRLDALTDYLDETAVIATKPRTTPVKRPQRRKGR